MENPFVDMFDDIAGIIKLTIIVFICLVIIGAFAYIPGVPSEAKVVAEQTSNSIRWLLIFAIGIFSMGGFIALIGWIKKKFNENKFYDT